MKNKVILVGIDGRPSMKGVFKEIVDEKVKLMIRRCPQKGDPYFRTFTSENREEFKKEPFSTDFNDSVVIRWGNRIEIETNKSTVVYNKAEAIGVATDKALSRSVFINAGIRCPKSVNPMSVQEEDYPIIARPKRHAKGKNFVVLPDYGTFLHHYEKNRTDWYYSAFVDKTEEFRVHCAHGKILGIMSKPAPTKKGVIAWNRAINGEEFTAVKWGDYNADVCLQALKAVKALGLDYGGVDVMLKDNKAYVLEVNTSPTLNSSPYMTTKYANYFDWLFKQDTRREHFNFEKYTKVVSYAWKVFNFEDRPAVKNEQENE